jgi:hypothetical protein
VITAETVPLSPSNVIIDLSPPLKLLMNEKKLPSKDIPLNSTTELLDPRLQTVKSTLRYVCYLESKGVKHAVQQQKRVNKYYGSKSKTNYTLIPFEIRLMSLEEYERTNILLKNTSPLSISVIDCFDFGLKLTLDQSYIDLEDNDNQLAFKQIQMSDQLIEQEKQLNSKEIRLHLREKQQKKIQEQINEQRKTDLANTKFHVQNGRKLLKEYPEMNSTMNQLPEGLLDFFSWEYQNEDRPHVKHILAELLGIFVEKYGLDYTKLTLRTNEGRTRRTYITL